MKMMQVVALTMVPFLSALDIEEQPSAVGFNPSALSAYTSFLQDQLEDVNGLPFVDAMIVKNGKLVYQFQESAQRLNETITDDSLFELFSATKILTTLGVMICYDRGLLHLNDPLSKFIPEFGDASVYVNGTAEDLQSRPAKYSPTIRHLLTHTSGIVGYGLSASTFLGQDIHPIEMKKAINGAFVAGALGPGIDSFIEKFPTLESFTAHDATYPLLFEPGTQFHYSHAHIHAARVVEVVTGMTFGDFMQKNVFDPLEMHTTGWTVDCNSPNKLNRYTADMAKIKPPTIEGNGYILPSFSPGLIAHADSALAGALNPHCASTALLDHGVFYFADAQGVGAAKDWVNIAKMLSPAGGGRGTFNGKRILSPRTTELMWQNHLPSLDLKTPWLDTEAMSTMGINFVAGPGVGFGLGGTVLVDPVLAGSIKSKGTWGWAGAAMTHFYYDPVEDMSMILFTQKFLSTIGDVRYCSGENCIWQRLIYSALGATAEGTCTA